MTIAASAARRPQGFFNQLARLNWGIITLLSAIAMVGVVMHYSVSADGTARMPIEHATRFAIMLSLAIAAAMAPTRVWYAASYGLYGIALILLIGVEIAGETRMGATRWLDLGVISLQPSELMKVAIILALARYYDDLPPHRASTLLWTLPPVALIAVPVALVMHQPDLGTSVLIAAAGVAVMFLAGLRWRFILPALGAALIGTVFAYQMVLHDYQRDRIDVFLGLRNDPLGEGYHVLQSKIAIGSAGLTGQGYMQGSQSQNDFLPEKQTDFIFTMIVEEFGLVGGACVLILYGLLMAAAMQVAMRAKTDFGKLGAAGVAATLASYVIINTMMVTGLVPVVGIPLPMISYGGTAMMTLMAGFAFVLSIDLHRDQTGGRGILW
ncbi:MAG: rod shape-determining protein RodA [Alphaproteobacteria bacterium]|nr:rod shape-determining protein RodA [Alphaproteobacteria bacterium]